MVTLPRLVIAAPASGCGKTTVACGLMAALRARGLAVSGHKVGPDYIDPGYHALATGRPTANLDPFLCGEDLIAPLFRHGAAGAQVAVIEGVMGLFDGIDPGGTTPRNPPAPGGSLSPRPPRPPEGGHVHSGRPRLRVHRARRPAARGARGAGGGRGPGRAFGGRTGGRLRRLRPADPGGRVILNRVASDRHERLLRDALAGTGLPVYGAIRRTEGIIHAVPAPRPDPRGRTRGDCSPGHAGDGRSDRRPL